MAAQPFILTIDSVRPFCFSADKAAVSADFHLENGAC